MIGRFAGAALSGLKEGVGSVMAPYAVPIQAVAQGRHIDGLGAAAGLGAGALALGGVGYGVGQAHTLSRYKVPDLHDQILFEVQENNPELTLNQAQYEAAKTYAKLADKPKDWVDSYMLDVGADQGDIWGQMVHDPLSRYGRKVVPRNDEASLAQRPERGYVYLGDGEWKPGDVWDGTRSPVVY